jgi:hypothetical protein
MGKVVIEIPENIDLLIQAASLSQAISELNNYVEIIKTNNLNQNQELYYS